MSSACRDRRRAHARTPGPPKRRWWIRVRIQERLMARCRRASSPSAWRPSPRRRRPPTRERRPGKINSSSARARISRRSIAVARYDRRTARRAPPASRRRASGRASRTVNVPSCVAPPTGCRARRRGARERRRRGGFASPESFGVSQSTLDAIAACESGGNPRRRLGRRHLPRPVPVRLRHLGLDGRQRRPRGGLRRQSRACAPRCSTRRPARAPGPSAASLI